MPLTPADLAKLLQPYTAGIQTSDWPRIHSQLLLYLDLILKWNARINLTAIRTPEQIVRRHFGESLFAGAHLGPCTTLLDFGSGAGFPGLPIQLLRPDVQVTLAESRTRKAAFLREAVRSLQLFTEVWPARVESMPANRTFDAVTLRAVDDMPAAIASATLRAASKLFIISTLQTDPDPSIVSNFTLAPPIPIPESQDGILLIAHRREHHT